MRSKFFIGMAVALILVSLLPVAVSAAPQFARQPCLVIHTTNLGSWDLSETRAQGHNELVDGGLHIWTENNTSLDKAAGYYPLSEPLSAVSVAQLIYTASFGIEPGLQVVVDFDGNNSIDGILVGESVYGANWWLSNSAAQFVKDGAPHTGGGNGSNWFGTLTEWATAFPNAQVIAIGYSLGGGVHGDGIIESMTFGCYVFTFGLPQPGDPVQSVTPFVLPRPSAGFTCSVIVAQPIWGTLYAQTLGGNGEWDEWNGWVLMNFDKGELSFHTHDNQTVETQYLRVIANNDEAQPRYFERIAGGTCVEISDPLAQ